MKLFKTMTMALVLVGFGLSEANAVELRNCDTENHQVTITSPTMHKDYEFRARTLSLIVCVDVCEFDVAGVGKVTARPDDIVTIANGKVTAEPRPADSAK